MKATHGKDLALVRGVARPGAGPQYPSGAAESQIGADPSPQDFLSSVVLDGE